MLVYDIETQKPFPPRHENPIPGVEYAASSQDWEGLGIAVICAYDCDRKTQHCFIGPRPELGLVGNLPDFQKLIDRHSIILGFYSSRFDDKLLRVNGFDLPEWRCHDIWKLIKDAHPKGQRRGGLNLDACLYANKLPLKSDDAALAPVYWQRGQMARLIRYCFDDVEREVAILRLIWTDKFISPILGTRLKVPRPQPKQVELAL